LVWNCGVATSFKGPSAQGFDGATEVIVNGERLRINPKTKKTVAKMAGSLLKPPIATSGKLGERTQPLGRTSYDARQLRRRRKLRKESGAAADIRLAADWPIVQTHPNRPPDLRL
jgi:hypothetical protein